jgi:chromosome segregation ATPase
LTRANEMLTSYRSQLERNQATLNALKQELSEARRLEEEARQSGAGATMRSSALEEEAQAVRDQVSDLQRELERAQARMADLEGQLAFAQAKASMAGATQSDAGTRLAALDRDLADARQPAGDASARAANWPSAAGAGSDCRPTRAPKRRCSRRTLRCRSPT